MTSRAISADGTGIAYHVSGRTDGPTVIAVHGYPDNSAVWDGVANELDGDFRVVRYDVRGTGESDQPPSRSGYRIPRLIEDLLAVVDAVDDGRPVHLVGHDWGSVQCWPALSDPRLAGRIASYTSISGPSLDHMATWLRDVRAHPRATAKQLAHSYYVALFQLPRLPELAIRRGTFERALQPAAYRTERDKINGLELYRANVLSAVRRPKPARVDVPVLVIALDKDAFLIPQACVEAPAPYVRDLRTRTIHAEHWVISAQPRLVTDALREFVVEVDHAKVR